MRTLESFDNATWCRFFDFLADTSDLTDEEVRQELAEAGIDMRPAVARLLKLVEAHREARPPEPPPPEAGPDA